MKTRILYLLKFYIALIITFLLQKIIFLLCTLDYGHGTTLADWLAVLWHGLPLDSVTACYLSAIPLAVVLASIFWHKPSFKPFLTAYYIVACTAMALAFAADVVLYHFWGAKIDANELSYIKSPKEVLASVSGWSILLGALAIILIIYLYVRRLRRATPRHFGSCRRAWALTTVPLFGLLFLGIRGGVGTSTANVSYAYFSPTPYLNHSAINSLFNITHSLFKRDNLSDQFQTYNPDELSALTRGCYTYDPAIADTLLNQPRPDILFIIWEGAGSAMMLNDTVAPNFMQLTRQGILFTNCYANSYRTDRGLVCLMNGWPGLPTESLMKMPDKCRRLPSWPRRLQQAGYHTAFHYGGDIDFTNMRCFLSETGFQQVCGEEHYPHAGQRNKWGIADGDLLPLLLPVSQPSPSLTTVLTLSSHEPWDVPYQRLTDKRRNAFAYTDSCLGAFVHQLQHSPQWQNLLVIIVADHGIPTDGLRHEATRIPVLWLGGAVNAPRHIDCLMNQSDLAATLLAQLGLPDSTLCFSRNVLGPRYSAPFACHAYKNGIYYLDSTGVTQYDCAGLREVTDRYPHSPRRLRRALALLQLAYQKSGAL